MVSLFTDDVSMVAGYSRTFLPDWKKASLVQKYEHLDYALSYIALAGCYTIGKSWACVGQNLAYRRSAFYDVGGFSKIKHLLVNKLSIVRTAWKVRQIITEVFLSQWQGCRCKFKEELLWVW